MIPSWCQNVQHLNFDLFEAAQSVVNQIKELTLFQSISTRRITLTMFKLSRAFVVAAVLSSTVLCAPVPQGVGKPVSTGQSADRSAPASGVFGTTPQEPNYQTHPTGLCIIPAMARDAGLSPGQEQPTVQQAIELCPEAKTIAVSSKNSKRSAP
ncbi:unnamed protein product, partial [Rhizoctonia solani]